MKIDRFCEDAGDGSAEVQVRGAGDAYAQRNADGDRVGCGRGGDLGRADGGEEAQGKDAETSKQRHAEVGGGPAPLDAGLDVLPINSTGMTKTSFRAVSGRKQSSILRLTDDEGELDFAVFNFGHNFVASNIPHLKS